MQFLVKVILSALIIAGTSEAAKRSTLLASILISLPLTSLLALSWIYLESRDTAKTAATAMEIFWLVIPSLIFFVALSRLLTAGVNFWVSLAVSCCLTGLGYWGFTHCLRWLSPSRQ